MTSFGIPPAVKYARTALIDYGFESLTHSVYSTYTFEGRISWHGDRSKYSDQEWEALYKCCAFGSIAAGIDHKWLCLKCYMTETGPCPKVPVRFAYNGICHDLSLYPSLLTPYHDTWSIGI